MLKSVAEQRREDIETIDRNEEMKRDTQTESFYTKGQSDKVLLRKRGKKSVRYTENKRQVFLLNPT